MEDHVGTTLCLLAFRIIRSLGRVSLGDQAQLFADFTLNAAFQVKIAIYYRGPNNYQFPFEVHLRYHIITIIIKGIWNHGIDNCLGPFITMADEC